MTPVRKLPRRLVVAHRRRPGDPHAGRERGQRGLVVILTVMTMLAVMSVCAVVFDGSLAYVQHRQMQNASDSAAMAGSRALDHYKFSGAAWTTVNAAVQQVATHNKASSYTCSVITSTGSVIGPCSTQASVADSTAAGVSVSTTLPRATMFGPLTGRSTITATTTSAATIQPMSSVPGTPFGICGKAAAGGYNILNADGSINAASAAALGDIDIEAAQVPTCGAGSAWKGKITGDGDIHIGDWVPGNQGNGYSASIAAQVLGTTPCPSGGPYDDCDMLLPIIDSGTGNGTTINLHVANWAVFHMSGDGHGNPKYSGRYVSTATILAGGSTGTGSVTSASTLRAIKLY
ncbi:MAG: Protein of unknown function rane [Acidimicrobiales bacterium]|nr:Protein of unknown function rane [Acidimicrobiales bacterium]